jgi:hypothetical protein
MTGNLALSFCTKQRWLRFSLLDRQKIAHRYQTHHWPVKAFFV